MDQADIIHNRCKIKMIGGHDFSVQTQIPLSLFNPKTILCLEGQRKETKYHNWIKINTVFFLFSFLHIAFHLDWCKLTDCRDSSSWYKSDFSLKILELLNNRQV